MWYLIICLLGFGATVATAGVRRPIDFTKQADVNGQVYDTQNLKLNRVPLATRKENLAPLGSPRVSQGTVPQKTLPQNTLKYGTRHTVVVPTTNFQPRHQRRSVPATPTLAPKVHEAVVAPITDREIRANTKAGEAELKEQLNRRH